MLDSYNRNINYLRISITNKCNYNCTYCKPKELDEKNINLLSLQEIVELAKTAFPLGFTKIRLTGGEPLLRHDIVEIISKLLEQRELQDLSITTNGSLLKNYAHDLKKAGLKRINVSLDTLSKTKYKLITGTDKLDAVIDGLMKAKELGFNPIKLNCVLHDKTSIEDRINLTKFAESNNFQLRFIKQMNISKQEFWPVIGGESGYCPNCNRLRVTCEGKIYPCLFSSKFFDSRKLGFKEAIKRACLSKPLSGKTKDRPRHQFYEIGG